jgi:hypothetical protein
MKKKTSMEYKAEISRLKGEVASEKSAQNYRVHEIRVLNDALKIKNAQNEFLRKELFDVIGFDRFEFYEREKNNLLDLHLLKETA